MTQVDFWPLENAAREDARKSLGCAFSLPSPSLNEIIEGPASEVFRRLGVYVVFERVGLVVMNQATLGKINVSQTSSVRRPIRWPLR